VDVDVHRFGSPLGRNDRAILNAGLRDAEAMYRAMGAPDPGDRLAEELRAMR